jgi:AcrR family transcriptional regulator
MLTEVSSSDSQAAHGLSLRERKKLRIRRALADAALDLFTERGFEATTLDELVDTVEVSKRTFFRNFASKEDAAFAPGTELWSAVLRSVAERPLADPVLLVLRGALTDTVGSLDGRPGEHREPWPDRFARMMRLNHTTPALRAHGLAYCADVSRQLVAILASRLDLPAHDLQLRMLVDVAVAAWHLAAQDWQEADQPATTAALARRLETSFATLPGCLTLSAAGIPDSAVRRRADCHPAPREQAPAQALTVTHRAVGGE